MVVQFPLYFLRSHLLLLLIHLSSRNADDPEVSLQLQRQLHRPPHLRVHEIAAEDGEGTPEPTAGQPRGDRDQHRYCGTAHSLINTHVHVKKHYSY